MSSDIVLACQGLGKTFIDADVKVEVLKQVDLRLHAGQQIAIVGASGSGKSTLLHLLGGLDRPTQGEVTIMGQNIHRLSSAAAGHLRNRALGFVYQFHHLLAEFTALENVAMPLLIGGAIPRQAMQRAEEMLCKVGLGERLKHKPGKLSGGERQRAAVARAMVNEPACILADEPTGNLDKHTAEQIYLLMLRLSAELKISFITVTHDMELAAKMDQAFLLEEGVLRPASFSRSTAI